MSRQKGINREDDRMRESQRGERFVEAMGGQTYAVIADAVGAAGSTIHNYASGKIPSADMGIKIAHYLGVDLDWWINGSGATSSASAGMVYVPVRGMPGSAISYSSGLIELLKHKVDSLFCTFGVGTMMHPTIPKEAELICTADIHPLKDGCVYMIRMGTHEVIRRLRIKPNNVIEARCDNPSVQQERPDEIGPQDVIAEVLWVSHAPHG